MANPLVAQGTLNRVRCSIIVPSDTSLNIETSYMGKSFASISFDGPFAGQIETGTGVVNSPEPYVMGNVSVGLLRTQSLSTLWMNQSKKNSDIGQVIIHSDSAAFAPISLASCVINMIEPGVYDGTDPVVKLAIKGVFYLNEDMWNL